MLSRLSNITFFQEELWSHKITPIESNVFICGGAYTKDNQYFLLLKLIINFIFFDMSYI